MLSSGGLPIAKMEGDNCGLKVMDDIAVQVFTGVLLLSGAMSRQ